MTYSIIYERITDGSLPSEYFYAHVPALDLTTHGKGINGAKQAAVDLINLWIAEKRANNEKLPVNEEIYFSKIEIDDALYCA
ncbi:MAG: type II toxin-antitoxin system HicB family antitoxin [Bacteroidetes bacterium]|nr:type II toxin-antitoxin system HicB family antitoxin [Bacteroidota bacterium]